MVSMNVAQVVTACDETCPATAWYSANFTINANFRKIKSTFKTSSGEKELIGDVSRPCNRIEWNDGEVWVKVLSMFCRDAIVVFFQLFQDCDGGKHWNCCTELHKCREGLISG